VNIEIIYISIYSYFLGSIPFGLILTKIFLNKDLREIGSGNIGATNALRTGKKSLGVLTLIFDGLKGYLSVLITLNYLPEYIYYSALLCLLGHVFPVWLKFKGGKGVAVYIGILFSFSINLGVLYLASWLIVLFFFKYSSLSSLISTLIVFICSIFFKGLSESVFFFIIFIIIIYTHRENIFRLRNKKESKIEI
jgi:glycerol-3-phosphate acyltransferase PlsY